MFQMIDLFALIDKILNLHLEKDYFKEANGRISLKYYMK